MQKTCSVCGEEFESTQSKAKYCSKECRAVSATKNRKLVQKYTFKCQHCGKEYHPKDKRRSTFCSRECSYAKMSKVKKEKETIKKTEQATNSNKICRVCGKSYHLNRLIRGSVCSDECRKELACKKTRRSNAIKKQNINYVCRICGKTFKSDYGNKRRLFCSDDCLSIANKDQQHKDKHTRRSIKRNAFVSPVSRKEIYKRDHWICQLCGKKVDKNKKVPHDYAPTLDHIVPLSLGGKHEPKNVQCAHFICNSAKGNRSCQSQLRLLG